MAEVKVTKNPASTPENVIFDFEIPGGEKGDPGGFNSGTNLGNVSLDTLKAPGLYKQSSSSNVTLANGYPANLANASEKRCVIEVTQWGATEGYVNQIVYPINGNNAVGIKGGAFYKRSSRNGTDFTDWEAYSSTRTDQTAGRAIYQWDELNNREQLIYGDTGWRDIRSLVPDYVSGSIKARRQGNVVTISTETLVLTGAAVGSSHTVDLSGGNFALSENQVYLPLGGFFKGAAHTFVGAWNGTHQIRIQDAVGSSQVFGQVSFVVRGAWPTSLPGTSSGTIPNL